MSDNWKLTFPILCRYTIDSKSVIHPPSGVAGVLAALCGSQIRHPPSRRISYWCKFLLLLSIYDFEAPRVFVLAS